MAHPVEMPWMKDFHYVDEGFPLPSIQQKSAENALLSIDILGWELI
jgi:hypothetical protein